MAPLPHFDGGKLYYFECKSYKQPKPSIEIDIEHWELICKSCYKQIQRENKIKNLLNEEETETR